MNITDRLRQLDSTLKLHNEGFWQNEYDPDMRGYASFNDAGIEAETGEFLYGMVRVLKPTRILETGTHFGIGASYMGMGLKDNNHGVLETFEFLPEIRKVAIERFQKMFLSPKWITSYLMDAKDFIPEFPDKPYKLILLDTEPQTRFAELIKFYPYLAPGGFVFIHDLHQHMHQVENAEHGFAWPYGKLPQEIKDMVLTGHLRPFHFETPRGLTGFYKVDSNDYLWI
jgi:predicted O-methyltransferase YrrM